MISNLALSSSTIALTHTNPPSLSLQDAALAVYLIFPAWIASCLGIATYSLMTNARRIFVEITFIIHNYYVLSFQLWVFTSSHSLGSFPACNSSAIIFVFVPIQILNTGRILFIALTIFMLSITTTALIFDIYRTIRLRRTTPENIDPSPLPIPSTSHPSYNSIRSWQPFDFTSLQLCLFIFYSINSAFSITFTELTISRTSFINDSTTPLWTFGQILPLLLVLLPILNFLRLFFRIISMRYLSRFRRQPSPVISLTIIQN